MRKLAASFLTLALSLSACGTAAWAADPPALDGNWKLTVLPFGDDEFLILDVKTDGGKTVAKVINAQPFLGTLKADEIAAKGDDLTVTISGQGEPMAFRGTVKGDKALGSLRFSGTHFPARLEKTEAEKVGPLSPSAAQIKAMTSPLASGSPASTVIGGKLDLMAGTRRAVGGRVPPTPICTIRAATVGARVPA